MITVEEAHQIILDNCVDYGTEEVDILNCHHRILREDIHADRDLPPFDRVTMDGICLQHATIEAGHLSLPIRGIVPAGSPQTTLEDGPVCLEIMTGAILPKGADTVIRYEDLEIADGVAKIQVDNVNKGQNIHIRGRDRQQGEMLIKSGKTIGAAEVNVLATTGKVKVKVAKTPKVLIVSTGNELVEIDQSPAAHQIRRSNVYGLSVLLQSLKVESYAAHLPDDKKIIEEKLRNGIEEYDAIILSGGVSKGKYDFIPEVLEFLGVQKLFHKIKQRPGKPFWFGRHPNGTVVFALPGNPVSSFLCTYRYFMPWLESSLKQEISVPVRAILASPIEFKKDLTYFAQVKLDNLGGKLTAIPVQGNGSGDLANLVEADAFMELAMGKDAFLEGEVYPVYVFKGVV